MEHDLETLKEIAQPYHEAKHFILGKVDRERFPSYLDCPYWPCRDARRMEREYKLFAIEKAN